METSDKKIKLYKQYDKIHTNSKLVIMLDKEVTTEKNTKILVDELMQLTKINIDFLIKFDCTEGTYLDPKDLEWEYIKKKLIYIDSKWLLNNSWERVNSLDIQSSCYKEKIQEILGIPWNEKFKSFIKEAENNINNWNIDRVHIIPFWGWNLINELYSIDWVWTIIWKWFWNPEISWAKLEDVQIIKWLLDINSKLGFLKSRSIEYISNNYNNFIIAYVDSIPVWCVEIIPINDNTVELWALSVVPNYLSHKIWLKLIKFVEDYAESRNKTIISVTDSPKLEKIYENNWYILDFEWKYEFRIQKSPGKKLYYK